ncbi:putative disease resistance RPP13 protein [Trifolium repens]|nr:putative disease resistance RPP13 protein [Trifolium repens]
MLTEFVGGGAFLCSVFQVIRDRLASRVFKDYFDDETVYKLESTLNSIKKLVEDAETKQYQNLDVKNWLDDLKNELYELEQTLNVLEEQKNLLGLQEDSYEIQLSREFTNEFLVDDESVIFYRKHDEYDEREEFEIKVWVRVSESFDLISLTRSIIESIQSSALYHTNLDRLKRELQQRLAGKRYFLVRNKDGHTWENCVLRFSGSSGDNIIVITHYIELASVMGSTRLLDLLRLKQSEEDASWSLFVKHAFGSRNVFDCPNLESIANKIVEKYRGFPFALKTLGNLLRTKFNQREWIEILETPLWRLAEDDNHINSLVRLFYRNLSSNLKCCFAYCSIFPKGYEFEKNELIKLWMAESLLKCWGSDQNEEELGNKFFDHLVSISFFQQSIIMPLWTGKYYFTMHDLVNDLSKSVSGESCLRIEGENVQDIPERTRHIWCCLDFKDGDRKLEHISKIEGLRSLMVEAQGYGDQRFKISTNVQQKLFSSLKYLRMLSFSGCNLLELDDEIRNLKLLRYLDLSYTEIASLPNSISDAVATNLKYKKHLEELSMSYGEWTDIDGSMPPFGQFPSLKKLSFSGCDGIEIIGTEFYCYNSSHVPFRSLEILRFEHMSEWKEWLCIEGFPLLQELCIKHCPKLKSALPQHLPSLQKLEIIDCQELEASIPKAANISELELKRCDEILINELPSSLKRVILCGTQVIQSSLEKILFNSDFLEELEVEDFFGENLELSSSDFNSCNSLRTLTIIGWHSSSLPFALHLFTNLNSLVLYDSPWLESFFGWQLPSNLCNLRIERCPKLMASREEWGLFQLNSLKQFRISDDFEIFECFPEESLLPSSINSLELTNCSKLRIINYKGLLHLTSLESLYIEDCPCLESLPEEGLPSSLSTLSIHDCPLIMQQYQKERGERWHTISHISDVTIS